MKTPKEIEESLSLDPTYQRALDQADVEQRKRIEATVHTFIERFTKALAPVAKKMAEDPVFARQVMDAAPLVTSGSHGH